jgi:hypothetical protein
MINLPYMSNDQLEKEFSTLVEYIGKEINDKVKQANLLLQEACELSDRYGVPFRSPISQLEQSYVPESFRNRFKTLDKEEVSELVGMYQDDLDYARGWRHSQVGC